MHYKLASLITMFGLLLAGCGSAPSGESTNAGTNPGTEQGAALPAGFFLEAAPGAVSVSAARTEAKTGETVTFTGYIGGRAEPFTADRAILLVADPENAPACEDECPIPWDACCTPSAQIAANTATVQIVDGEGKMLAVGLEGKNGLEPGATVTVVGTVREANESVFIVDATGLAVDTTHEG